MGATQVRSDYKRELDQLSMAQQKESQDGKYYREKYVEAMRQIDKLKLQPKELVEALKKLSKKYYHSGSQYVKVEDVAYDLEQLLNNAYNVTNGKKK